MGKFLKILFLLSICLLLAKTTFAQEQLKYKKVLVIVPIEHLAMSDIVAGIRSTMSNHDQIDLIVKNAHGDMNIMLSLIKQYSKEIDLFMPIGAVASQMTISHVKNKPIICVAADLSNVDKKFVTGVNDEISRVISLQKLPKLKNIAIVYSANEKVVPQIKLIDDYAKQNGIAINKIMIQNLLDLPVLLSNAPKEVQAFLVLKDHLIVSGINILLQEAKKRFIPVITSDEGTVKSGATFAFGVKEHDIGVTAGKIFGRLLTGKNIEDIAYKNMDTIKLFMNNNALTKQRVFRKEELLELGLESIEY